MIFNLSQSKIYSSMNFREALQPQSVNKFTLYVCPTLRLLKQSHEFCTQRAEAHLVGATQRKSNFSKAFARRGGIKKILVVDMVNAIVSHIKTLRETKKLRDKKNRKTAKPYNQITKYL